MTPSPLTTSFIRGITLTLACAWVTLGAAHADAQPRLLPDQTLSVDVEAPRDGDDISLQASLPADDGDTRSWVRAKMVRQWGVMMLVQSLAWTAVLAMEAGANDGYPFQEDEYGCGGRAAPIATAVVGAVGLALTIKGTFGMRRHVDGRPVRFGPERGPIRRWSPLLAAGAVVVGGVLSATWLHDVFCNT